MKNKQKKQIVIVIFIAVAVILFYNAGFLSFITIGEFGNPSDFKKTENWKGNIIELESTYFGRVQNFGSRGSGFCESGTGRLLVENSYNIGGDYNGPYGRSEYFSYGYGGLDKSYVQPSEVELSSFMADLGEGGINCQIPNGIKATTTFGKGIIRGSCDISSRSLCKSLLPPYGGECDNFERVGECYILVDGIKSFSLSASSNLDRLKEDSEDFEIVFPQESEVVFVTTSSAGSMGEVKSVMKFSFEENREEEPPIMEEFFPEEEQPIEEPSFVEESNTIIILYSLGAVIFLILLMVIYRRTR